MRAGIDAWNRRDVSAAVEFLHDDAELIPMRAVFEGWQSRAQALDRYTEFSAAHRRGFRVLLFFQRLIPWIPQRLLAPAFRIYRTQRLVDFTFHAYLRVAPPDFADAWLADDEEGPGEQQRDAEQPLRAERDFVQAE